MTFTVRSVLRVSSIFTSVRAAGIAMATRMTTGITVQITSALVLWSKSAETAPFDLRNVAIE